MSHRGLDLEQFSDLVTDILGDMDLYSEAARDLVIGTAIQESRIRFLVQIGGGPALGVCQMEPATHDDIYENYLRYKQPLHRKLLLVTGVREMKAAHLRTNLGYSIAMCRIHYLRRPEPLPSSLEGQAAYWKLYYNTPLGAGTEEEYIEHWEDAWA